MSNPKKAYYAVNQVLLHFEAQNDGPIFPLAGGTQVMPIPDVTLQWLEARFRVRLSVVDQRAHRLAGNKTRAFAFVRFTLAKGQDSVAVLVAEMTNQIDKSGGRVSVPAANDKELLLIGVTPNWLCGATQGTSIGIGGPGSVPTIPRALGRVPPITWSAEQERKNSWRAASKRDVHVFVLDTLRLDERGEVSPPRLEIDDAVSADSNALLVNDEAGHPIKIGNPTADDSYMPEHGPFIAGIIKAIAPKAIVHVVQVLNDHGIGSIESIAAGFETVSDMQRKLGDAPCLVNCSFVIAAPVGNSKQVLNADTRFTEHDTTDLDYGAQDPDRTRSSHALFSNIVDLALAREIQAGIVAAAGNDSAGLTQGTPPFKARYPARLDQVLGVGALEPGCTRADFSNAPDRPGDIGLMTLGRLVAPFFDSGTRTMGLREWAGTSFAAPVITGLIAKLMGEHGFEFARAVEELRQAEPSVQRPGSNREPDTTGEIITVTQS